MDPATIIGVPDSQCNHRRMHDYLQHHCEQHSDGHENLYINAFCACKRCADNISN